MAVKGKDTKLQYADDLDGPWNDIARVRTIDPPERTAPEISTTCLESDAQERIPDIVDVGQTTAEIEYDKEQAGELDALFGELKAWRTLYPDGSGRKWMGWLSSDSDSGVENGSIIVQEVQITASGDVERFEADAGS